MILVLSSCGSTSRECYWKNEPAFLEYKIEVKLMDCIKNGRNETCLDHGTAARLVGFLRTTILTLFWVKILGRHDKGVVPAKVQFSPKVAAIELK